MPEGITIPGESGVFQSPKGMVFADKGYLRLPNGKIFRYDMAQKWPPEYIEVSTEEILAFGEIMPMFDISMAVEIDQKWYVTKNGETIDPGSEYRLPDGRIVFCIRSKPKPKFMSSFDGEPIPRVLGPGIRPVYELIEV